MKVALLCDDIVRPSGGAMLIVECAAALRRRGHEVALLIDRPIDPSELGWHPDLRDLRIDVRASARNEPVDIALATYWATVFALPEIEARVYGYFNQSVESRFTSNPAEKFLNRVTYALPLLYITGAAWVGEFIRRVCEDGRVFVVRNGLSRRFFPLQHPMDRRDGRLRVLVEGPWGLARKGVAEAFDMLARSADAVPLEVCWLTSASRGMQPKIAACPVRVFERVPIMDVHRVYRANDLLLKLSVVEGLFGPPLEMFSQGGTAITYNVSGHDEYMMHGKNALVLQPFNRDLIPRILATLHGNRAHLLALKEAAYATATGWPTTESSTAEFVDILERQHAQRFTNAFVRRPLAAIAGLRGFASGDAPSHMRGSVLERAVDAAWRSIGPHRREWVKRHAPAGLARLLLEFRQ